MSRGEDGNPLLRQVLEQDCSLGAAVSVIRWLRLASLDGDEQGRELLAAAVARMRGILTDAAEGDFPALSEVTATDPISMLHAFACAGPERDAAGLAGRYEAILRSCGASGIDLIPGKVAGLAEQFFRTWGDFPVIASGTIAAGDEAFTAADYAVRALEASHLGAADVDPSAPDLLFLSRASLLLAARRRNCSEAGLLLLGHSICFGDDDVAHVLEWLQRIRRDDGLYGIWELFDDSCTAANLAANVNVQWALSARSATKSGPRPRGRLAPFDSLTAAFAPLPMEDAAAAAKGLRTWVERNIDAFVAGPFRDQTDYGDQIKPLVELVLALWIIARIAEGSENAEWARRQGARIAKASAGEGLIEGIRIFPTSILAALMFPMLEQITGDSHPHGPEIRRLIEDNFSERQERIPMRQMDYFFMRWLISGGARCHDEAIYANLQNALVCGDANPCYLTNDSVYDITHAIFYATKFGAAPFEADTATQAWCATWIPELCVSFLLEDDLDVGAELLINWLQLDLPRTGSFWFALRLILHNLNDDGSAPGPRRLLDYQKLSPFERDYHTSLIVLIALIAAVEKD
jgi:hypothetical protein